MLDNLMTGQQMVQNLSVIHHCQRYYTILFLNTLESGIDVGQGINVEPGKFVKKNNRRALNKRRA